MSLIESMILGKPKCSGIGLYRVDRTRSNLRMIEVPNVYISDTSFAMCLNVLLYENKLNSLEISLLGHFN